MSIYSTAVGYWLATAYCLYLWLLTSFFLFFFCFAFLKSRGFVQGPGIVEIGEEGVILFCSHPFFFFFSSFQLYYFGAAFGGNPGIYQTRYHSVQELF